MQNNDYYHIYNRGVDKRNIFEDDADRYRFIKGLIIFNDTDKPSGKSINKISKPVRPINQFVDIIAFCLMDNHYHLLIKQVRDYGISKFCSKFANGYTKYFNKKYNRSGRLFSSPYQYKHINSSGQLMNLSRYIHTNPIKIINKNFDHRKLSNKEFESLTNYKWSSLNMYMKNKHSHLSNPFDILEYFSNKISEYQKYIMNWEYQP